jgi:uncharacterized membrane protein
VKTSTHPAAERYLKELNHALSDLPRARRLEIVDEIRSHIEEATPDASEAGVLTALDQLGDPETIAADARERLDVAPKPKAGTLEGIAIAGLLIGGLIVPVIGWFLGVVLLWISRVWTTRDKLIGTFVLPGGLALVPILFLFAAPTVSMCEPESTEFGRQQVEGVTVTACAEQASTSEWWWIALMILIALLPIATAVYLGRRAWSPR